MFETEAECLATLQATTKSVNKVLNSGKTVVKALEKLTNEKAFQRQDYIADVVEVLKTCDLTIFGCGQTQRELCSALEKRLRTLRMHAHQTLLEGLTKRIEKSDHIRIISDNPLVIYVHPLTLEVNFELAKATWTYAHEPLQVVSLDPAEIMTAHAALVDAFRDSRVESRVFSDLFKTAYDMVLLKNKLPSGSRVDIVELLTPLAWLWPNAFATKKTSALPRYLLAYQLQKLRADKMLQFGTQRLELGTATGGTTKNKANVLFIPLGPSEGQYYLSICIR